MGFFDFFKRKKVSKEEQDRVMENARKLIEKHSKLKEKKENSLVDNVNIIIHNNSTSSFEFESKFTPEFKRDYAMLREARDSLYQELKSITFKYNNGELNFETCNNFYEDFLEREFELRKEYEHYGVSYKYIYDYWNEKRKLQDGEERIDLQKFYLDKIVIDNDLTIEDLKGRRIWDEVKDEGTRDIIKGFSKKFRSQRLNDNQEVCLIDEHISRDFARNIVYAQKEKEKVLVVHKDEFLKLLS